MKRLLPYWLPALLCLLLACDSTDTEKNANDTPDQEQLAPQRDSISTAVGAGVKAVSEDSWDKKIIKNGVLHVEVADYSAYGKTVREYVTQAGGYVSNEEQLQSDYKKESTIRLKIPVDRFEELLGQLAVGGKNVLSRKITSQDVSGEVMDTRARLEAKKRVRIRYLDLLNSARNMSEILEVQAEINKIQVEIEAATGRVNFLNHASAMSTIDLVYFQWLNPAGGGEPTPSFGTRILDSLRNGAVVLADILVALSTLWPFWLAALVGWYIFKRKKSVKLPAGSREL